MWFGGLKHKEIKIICGEIKFILHNYLHPFLSFQTYVLVCWLFPWFSYVGSKWLSAAHALLGIYKHNDISGSCIQYVHRARWHDARERGSDHVLYLSPSIYVFRLFMQNIYSRFFSETLPPSLSPSTASDRVRDMFTFPNSLFCCAAAVENWFNLFTFIFVIYEAYKSLNFELKIWNSYYFKCIHVVLVYI